MRTERFRGALISALIVASLMALAISLFSVSPSSAASTESENWDLLVGDWNEMGDWVETGQRR